MTTNTWRKAKGEKRILIEGRLIAPDAQHGTQNAYVNLMCRCLECTLSNTLYCAERRRERFAERVVVDGRLYAPYAPQHGLYSTYSNWGCRCNDCTDAWKIGTRVGRARR